MGMDWYYKGHLVTSEDVEGYTSFVYRITNRVSGKEYIGKKCLTSYRRKIIKGRKNRKKITSESNWKEYFGSNAVLQEDVKLLGEEQFSREILRLCTSLGEASYYEAKYIFLENVLYRPEKYYNQSIQCRIHGTHLLGKGK